MTGKNQGFREKPVPVPLCPPQIPYGLPCKSTWASVVRSLCYGMALALYIVRKAVYTSQPSFEWSPYTRTSLLFVISCKLWKSVILHFIKIKLVVKMSHYRQKLNSVKTSNVTAATNVSKTIHVA
jgi:hypothetical protein